jgi:ribosomal protection tetracycline resistance protein
VFKVERGAAGEKVAYVRMFSGIVRTRDRLELRGNERKVTAIQVFEHGGAVEHTAVAAGQIGKLWGLGDVQIGDAIGAPRRAADEHHFAPPTLETVVAPARRADTGALNVALTQLAEQDPLINLRQDDVRQELFVSLYGEVQKEVIQEMLANDFGIDVEFRATTTICIERPVGTGAAFDVIAKDGNPFLATVGLRVEPAPIDTGVSYAPDGAVHGTMPFAFFKAVEETVHACLHQGINGWQVTDCKVTLTHTGYWPRQSHSHAVFDKSMSSTAGDFRNLTPLVLMRALQHAGTMVYEPIQRFRLEIPADLLGPMLPALARVQAAPGAPTRRGDTCALEGEIPAARVHELQQQLPALTRGEGVLECVFGGYRPVRGTPPTRARTDGNPLNRKEYLLNLRKRS